jgi:hypothetical protein|eukprot:COSAG02_NODE_11347_length_1742_cov_2.356665_2_plen_66_part_00
MALPATLRPLATQLQPMSSSSTGTEAAACLAIAPVGWAISLNENNFSESIFADGHAHCKVEYIHQ